MIALEKSLQKNFKFRSIYIKRGVVPPLYDIIICLITVPSDDSVDPEVGVFSTIKLKRPVKIVDTDQAGFQVSGWKSDIDKHNLEIK